MNSFLLKETSLWLKKAHLTGKMLNSMHLEMPQQ